MEATIQNFTNHVNDLFAKVEDIRELLVVEHRLLYYCEANIMKNTINMNFHFSFFTIFAI
ncbi:hypothetical protein FACS189452_04070 [Bacteroidia bacterium]|nr:hypothetical protein FACS189452_04070 [Bacteroidia bacterium]